MLKSLKMMKFPDSIIRWLTKLYS